MDAVFVTFDTDKNGSLDPKEVGNLINAALKHMIAGREVTNDEVSKFMKAADKSGDGKIQKPELYEIFKKVLS